MRRRIRSAAFPLHRHSLPQLAVDGGLVALAYFLAYRLRFDGAGGVPERYHDLFEATLGFVVVGIVAIFTLFGLYQKWWRYVVAARLRAHRPGVAGRRARARRLHRGRPAEALSRRRAASCRSTRRPACSRCFLLLHARVRRRRALRRARDLRAPAARLPRAQGRARRADRRRRRRRPARAARDPAQPGAAAQARSASSTTTRASAARASSGVQGARHDATSSAAILDEVEPDEVMIAIPSAPGTLRAASSRACRERGIPVRTLPTVFELLQTGGQLVRQVREVAGRGHARPRAGADGARPRRRVPDRRGRARHRRRRLDRLGAVPPDRARRAARGWSCSTTPRTTSSRSSASSSDDRHVHPTRSPPCSRTARRRSGCARSSPSTARPSSSTPPPTSTSG